MQLPAPPKPSTRLASNTNVIYLDPYDSCQRKAIKRGERNFVTAQKAYKEFAAAAEIVLWDLQALLKPAFDNVAQYMDELDELDQDALLTMASKDDAKAILLLHALVNMTEHELPSATDFPIASNHRS